MLQAYGLLRVRRPRPGDAKIVDKFFTATHKAVDAGAGLCLGMILSSICQYYTNADYAHSCRQCIAIELF